MTTWRGPKVALPQYPDEAIYGLDVEQETAVYLGRIAGEVPHMPPYDRELGLRNEVGLMVTSGPLRGRTFRIVEQRQQGDGDGRDLNDAA